MSRVSLSLSCVCLRWNSHISSVLSVCLSLVEEVASKRVAFYGTLECVVYVTICAFQVYYIKSLLDSPSKVRSWV